MEIPSLIPVERIEDYHTHYIGKCADGRQFWGRERVWTFSKPGLPHTDPAFKLNRQEYVLLNIFDAEGNLIDTKANHAGNSSTADLMEMAEQLEGWIAELGGITYCDIAVKLHQVEIDGFTFGLVADHDNECICLKPGCSISFTAPWNGSYET